MNEMMKEIKMGAYTRMTENGEEFYDFNFHTDLTVAEKLKFVDSVVNLLVDENHYNSVIHNIIFDFFIIDVFTDVDTTEFKNSPAFLDDVEQFLEETNIVEIVRANASHILFNELNNAVDKSIQYLTGIHPNPLNEALASLISTLEKKINEVDLESMMGMAQKFANMTEDFSLENVVNTYMDSDTHKKNLAEIMEAKNKRAEFAEDLDKAIKIVNENNNK